MPTPPTIGFDRSHLPPADFEFVVVADTHYMIDAKGGALEFESRRKQTERSEYALHRIAALDVPLVIHMGDLVQEYPETPRFAQAVAEARAQLERCGVNPRRVAGNHDVGDKHDPIMPAQPVTNEFLENYHAQWGPSWTSWEQGGLHFVVLNSQIMNSGLPAEAEQRAWLEADLAAHENERTVICLHLPPFLRDEGEPALGHYDNIDEPARGWLLDLVRRHSVELIFAAHIHWSFYNEIAGPASDNSGGRTRYHTTPSTAFTRPGFSEMFSSPPPPEQGRDDTPKLGFYLVRVQGESSRVHLVRTEGRTDEQTGGANAPAAETHLLTRTSPDLPASPLGVSPHHALARTVDTPSVWPSVIRQPVRNDYPLLACTELGVRHLRIPATDLADPLQRERLAILRAYGAEITATWMWRDSLDLAAAVAAHRAQLDTVEVIIPGTPTPSDICLQQLAAVRAQHGVPLALSTAIPGRSVVGKQHPRFQRGYIADDLAELDARLAGYGLDGVRVLCRLAGNGVFSPPSLAAIGAVDYLWELPDGTPAARIAAAATVLWRVATQQDARLGGRLFIEPLVDLDRTMDITAGLLDRRCNPRPVFHALRALNTLLFSEPGTWSAVDAPAWDGGTVLGLARGADRRWLVLPGGKGTALGSVLDGAERCYGLMSGLVWNWGEPEGVEEPMVVV